MAIGQITSNSIAAGAVSASDLADGSITADKLSTGHPTWDSSGNLGIGTSSPVNQANTTALTIYQATEARLQLQNSTTGTTSSDGSSFAVYGSDLYINNREAGNSLFYVNGAERMRIDSSGRVGIGTNTPRNALTVNGVISGLSVTVTGGNTNTGLGGGPSNVNYLVMLSWNNGNGYAPVLVGSGVLNNSGVIIASGNSSGGNNAFDCNNSFGSNSGNGIAYFSNGGSGNLQTKSNFSAQAYPVYVTIIDA